MRVDAIGLTLSGICLLHCVAVPVVAFTLPAAAGLLSDPDSVFHWLLLGLAVPISGVAFLSAWRRHRARLPLVVGLTGLTIMAIGVSHVFGHAFEVLFTLVGVVAVALAHITNFVRAHGAHDHSQSDRQEVA